jgi:AraC-like DNA-binding protein
MSYDLSLLYTEVNNWLSDNPDLCFFRLSEELCCSYSTIQKAISAHSAHNFRSLKNLKRLEKASLLARQGRSCKEIATILGYSSPENFSRFLRMRGLSFKDLSTKTNDHYWHDVT